MSQGTSSQQPASPRMVLGRAISKLWWLILLRGVMLVLLGGYALFSPGLTLAALAQVLAIFAIIDGVLSLLAGMMGWSESRGWTLARGAICFLAGLFVLMHPLVVGVLAVTIIVCIIAIQIIATGILEVMVGIQQRKEMQGEGWLIFGGILSVILGSLILAAPAMFGLMLIRIIGSFVILFGIILITNAFRARKLGKSMIDVQSQGN